jgi:uncharacterized membrane protein YkvI
MKKILQISAVFIGTIVGAGLASGQEITQFFTTYGYRSFIGLIICMLMYISIGYMVINLSVKYKLDSYKDLIILVNSGYLGKITELLTSFFMLSGAAIILAGSGALIKQYFGTSSWIGIIVMFFAALIILLRNTQGIIEINSFIVPSLITVITTIFLLYIFFSKTPINIDYFKSLPYWKGHWFISSIIYGSFNILSFSGVLVPFCKEIDDKKSLFIGIILGASALTILSFFINFMLIINVPYIFKYEIPLLYITHRFGKTLQILLLVIIWLEMFSTEVSDIYSIGKTIEKAYSIPYKKAVLLVLLIAIPISQIGFKNLINYLYPAFGVISLIFVIQCIVFYISKKFKKD